MPEDVTLSDELLLGFLDEYRGNNGGTSGMVCACGRVNFNSDYDPEEGVGLEEIRSRSQQQPNAYCDHGDYSIHWVDFGEEQIMLGCSCGKDLELAKALWEERKMIADFLMACATKLSDVAKSASRSADIATFAKMKSDV